MLLHHWVSVSVINLQPLTGLVADNGLTVKLRALAQIVGMPGLGDKTQQIGMFVEVIEGCHSHRATTNYY